ncbi:hypothetical protein EBR96_00455 [bacterium]|nr:hypothetical protein [bacterium]
MRKQFQIVLAVLVAVGVVSALSVVSRRAAFERQTRQVELVASYRDLTKLAHLAGRDTGAVLAQLRQSSVLSAIALEEETVVELASTGKAVLVPGSELIAQRWPGLDGMAVQTDRYYFIAASSGDYERIYRVAAAEVGTENVVANPGLRMVGIYADVDDILLWGFGYDPAAVALIRKNGFGVIPRVANSVRVSDQLINEKFDNLAKIRPVNTIIFEGTSVLGYPTRVPEVSKAIAAQKINIGLIEFSDQAGMSRMASGMPEHVIRVHSLADGEIENLSTEVVINRYIRAAYERRIRIIYLKPFFALYHHSLGDDLIGANLAYFQAVKMGVIAKGLSIGPVTTDLVQAYYSAGRFERLGLGLAVVAAILLIVGGFRNGNRLWPQFLIGGMSAFLIAGLVVRPGIVWPQITAMLAVVAFPILGVMVGFGSVFGRIRSRYLAAFLRIITAFAIALAGALIVTGLLSDYSFVSGVRFFAGVKAGFVVPLIVVAFYFVADRDRIKKVISLARSVLKMPVYTYALLIGVVVLAGVAVYLIRSGNAPVLHVSDSELNARQWLESVLTIRPRTKEFLIGYPLLWLAAVMRDDWFFRWRWMIIGAGTMALVSMVNSFCHLHTPVVVSLLRGCIGLVLGLGISVVLTCFGAGIQWMIRKTK